MHLFIIIERFCPGETGHFYNLTKNINNTK